MKTYTPCKGDIEQKWILVDADQAILGRLSTQVAKFLLGKHKALYDVNIPTGDIVVVINSKNLKVTGQKNKDKIYYRHSGYPGGIKERTFEEFLALDPTEVLRHAVKGMLPKGPRGRALLRNLYVYSGAEHPHASQNPQPYTVKED